MAELLREERDNDHQYRMIRTDRGILVTARMKGEFGMMLPPAEWLYQTEEAASKGLKFVMIFNAVWSAGQRGFPTNELFVRCEEAAKEHSEAITRLNDQPVMGREVRELRRSFSEE